MAESWMDEVKPVNTSAWRVLLYLVWGCSDTWPDEMLMTPSFFAIACTSCACYFQVALLLVARLKLVIYA